MTSAFDALTRGASIPDPLVLTMRRLVTCDPSRSTETDALGAVDDAAVLVTSGRIREVGSRHAIQALAPDTPVLDCGDLVTPGLVDAHTHAAYMGSRHGEYALRLAGAGYEAIARSGGGIVSSMRAIRSATREEVAHTLRDRLARMASLGVTTCEVKSGYGLDLENETKQLEAIRDEASRPTSPRIIPTFLALHALPPEANGDRAHYARDVAERSVDAVADAGLAAFVDAYVDRNAFSVADARPVFDRARARGLGVRIHIGQFADVGGAELAADVGASSVDHLEHVSAEGAARLRAAGARAVLLPVASFTLGQSPPPVALFREAGLSLVVASDANPGTAPTDSLPLAMAFAARLYGLTVSEVMLGATREAALSLGLDDVGVVRPGARADLVAWDLPHENALVQPHAVGRAKLVLRDGVVLFALGLP